MEVAVKSLGQSRPAGPYRKPTMNLNKFFFSWPAKQLPIHIYMLQYILPALAPNCGAVGNHFGGDTIGSWPFFLILLLPRKLAKREEKTKRVLAVPWSALTRAATMRNRAARATLHPFLDGCCILWLWRDACVRFRQPEVKCKVTRTSFLQR